MLATPDMFLLLKAGKGSGCRAGREHPLARIKTPGPLGAGTICHRYGPRFRQLNRVSGQSGSHIGQGPASGPWGLPARLGSVFSRSSGYRRANSPFTLVSLGMVCPLPHPPQHPYAGPQLWNLKEAHVCLTLFSSGFPSKGQLSMSSSNFPHMVLRSFSSMEKAIRVSICGTDRH